MSSALLTIALAAVVGQTPIGAGYGGPPQGFSGGAAYPTGGGDFADPNANGAEQLYPFDAYDPWVHGYFQEIPAYSGFNFFRPYNYKHVLSQSQVAGGWGL